MAKKTFEQLNAEADKLRQQLKDIEDSKAEIAGAEADEVRKEIDALISRYNGLLVAAGKPEMFLAPHTGTNQPKTRGKGKAKGKPAEFTEDQKNKVMHAIQQAKGKPVKSGDLSKSLDGLTGFTAMLFDEIEAGRVKVGGPARNREFTYVGK